MNLASLIFSICVFLPCCLEYPLRLSIPMALELNLFYILKSLSMMYLFQDGSEICDVEHTTESFLC